MDSTMVVLFALVQMSLLTGMVDCGVSNPDDSSQIEISESSLHHHQRRQAPKQQSATDGNLKWIPSKDVPKGTFSTYDHQNKRMFYMARSAECVPCLYDDTQKNCIVIQRQKTGKNPGDWFVTYGTIKAPSYEFLVNEDDFEILEWTPSSNGRIPPNAVQTCKNVYIARTDAGLGYIMTQGKTPGLNLPGQNPTQYEVLTMNHDIEGQYIDQVNYVMPQKKVSENPQVLRHYTVDNKECKVVKQEANLDKTVDKISKYDFSGSLAMGVKTEVNAKIPLLAKAGVGLSGEGRFTMTYSRSTSVKQTHSIRMHLEVEPNHSCSMVITGNTFTATIPFTAVLTRTYKNNEVRKTSISGTYTGQEVGEIRGIVERCKPLHNPVKC